MKPAIALREKIAAEQPVLGLLITHHLCLESIELAIAARLDYAIVDAEHFDHGGPAIAEACRIGRLANFPILLRPAATDSAGLRLAMDLGPCGLLLPMIECAEQLDSAYNSLYLPPRGGRRPGGPSNHWMDQFTYEAFRRQVEDPLIVIPQIESPLGVENAEAIGRHQLTTAVGVGPFDLSIRLGVSGDVNHPKLRKSLHQIRSAAAAAGKPAWMIGDGPTLIAQGYRFICIGEPSLLLKERLREIVGSSWAEHRTGSHDENR